MSSSTSTTPTETSTTTQAPAQPVQLTFPKAINVLVQGVNHAQSKGIYTLADANLLHQSISLVNKVMVQSFGPQQQAQAQETDNDDETPSNPEDKQKA